MKRADLLTSINSKSEQLDRLLRQLGQGSSIGSDEIPDDVALQILEGYERATTNANAPSDTDFGVSGSTERSPNVAQSNAAKRAPQGERPRNRNQSPKTTSATGGLEGEVAAGAEAEFAQALASLDAIANNLNRLGTVAGVSIGQSMGKSIGQGVLAGLSAELGKFGTGLGTGIARERQSTTSLNGVLKELGVPPVQSSLSAIYQSDRNYRPELPPTPNWGHNN